jgi:hypothetical protein
VRFATAVGTIVLMLAWAGRAQVPGTTRTADAAVTLRVIVLTSAEAAESVATRLRNGESFALVAKSTSTAPNADDGGWLGKQRLSELRPEVRAAVQGLAPGHYSPVVKIPIGFAIFEVERDDPAELDAAGVGPAFASTGAVRVVADLSGFSEARTLLDTIPKPEDWNQTPSAACDAHTRSRAIGRAPVEALLANPQAMAARPPIDQMQLYVGIGQLDAYEGKLGDAIARFQKAREIAAADIPEAVSRMDEALGVMCLHKAEMDSGVQESPGESCLLGLNAHQPLRQPAEAQAAIDHFLRYLEGKPDDLEVRWQLNLAYRAIGGYPDKVPPRYLIPEAAFHSSENIGRFRDVAPQAGLVSVGLAGGLIVEDLRGTGRFDVVTSSMDSCAPLRFLGNNGDGTFTERTAEAGLSSQVGGLNIVPGDYNNDGCVDILVTRGGWEFLPQRMSLLRNDCNGRFTDVTTESGLGEPIGSQTAVWTDIDNDGFLDLFIGNETGAARLYRNLGNGTFADISKAAGIDHPAVTKGVAGIDYDHDRYPDLYVSNYGGANFLYHNNRNGTFTEVSSAARVKGTPTGFATWFFDYDNDGWPDLFVTSYVPSVEEIARRYVGQPRNGTTMKLYRNLGDGTFADVTAEAQLDRVQMPMGSNFGDIDNDGYLDIYLGTGHPSYAATVGAMLLHNKSGRSFVDVAASSGTGELHKGHGVAFADLDNDGDEDLLFLVGGATLGDRHALRLFENPGNSNDWIALKLIGMKSNKSAIGAQIKVTVEDANGTSRSIFRTVGTGGSFGASPLQQHIGLGKTSKPVDIDIWWPTSDTRQHFSSVQKDQWLQIQEFETKYTTLKRERVRLGGPVKRP